MASSSTSYNCPCAACKFLRRKCKPGCIFAPYFPPEDPQKFANVHKIFGASNVTKLLNDLHPHQRDDAVNSLAFEAAARVRDPVYGCVGAITFLQKQVDRLQKELDAANADLIRFGCNNDDAVLNPSAAAELPPPVDRKLGGGGGGGGSGGGIYYETLPNYLQNPYFVPWDDESFCNPFDGEYLRDDGF
ncbi:protein LATERAL ORGAN BOUNDARIES-like [Andrographis paniculata]|uniref:protein LATERAL ORGAN BOUNDARIES-like n=1 Tax=Andrographis paniculata TaxID=175694 RepID=UPI0021E7F2BA|nr:protein LATERAL ORGAN BOUNDARIES-like [Andrographis paniculata]